MIQFQQVLKNIKARLKHWKKIVFGNIHKAKRGLEQNKEDLHHNIISQGRLEELVEE